MSAKQIQGKVEAATELRTQTSAGGVWRKGNERGIVKGIDADVHSTHPQRGRGTEQGDRHGVIRLTTALILVGKERSGGLDGDRGE